MTTPIMSAIIASSVATNVASHGRYSSFGGHAGGLFLIGISMWIMWVLSLMWATDKLYYDRMGLQFAIVICLGIVLPMLISGIILL